MVHIAKTNAGMTEEEILFRAKEAIITVNKLEGEAADEVRKGGKNIQSIKFAAQALRDIVTVKFVPKTLQDAREIYARMSPNIAEDIRKGHCDHNNDMLFILRTVETIDSIRNK